MKQPLWNVVGKHAACYVLTSSQPSVCALQQCIRSVACVPWRIKPCWPSFVHWWSASLITATLSCHASLRTFWTDCSLCWMPPPGWSSYHGGRKTSASYSVNSTGCVFWREFYSSCACWCFVAFQGTAPLYLADSLRRAATADGRHLVTSTRPTPCCWSYHQPAARHLATAPFQRLQLKHRMIFRQRSEPHRRCWHSANISKLFSLILYLSDILTRFVRSILSKVTL